MAQSLMKEQGLDALVLSSSVNNYYFTGFDSLALYPTEDDGIKCTIIREMLTPSSS